jgi:hypothetical protein
MPYIPKKQHTSFLASCDKDWENPGQLNYTITNLIINYIQIKGESYQTYNDIIGVLECAKIELYRRKISEYEDAKKQINGDVYEEREPK